MYFIVVARCSSYSWLESTSPLYPNLGEHKDFQLVLQPGLMTHSSDDSKQKKPTVDSQFIEMW